MHAASQLFFVSCLLSKRTSRVLARFACKEFIMTALTTWDDFATTYQALLDEPLTAGAIPDWLTRWNQAEQAIWEARAWLKRAKLRDLTNPTARDAYQQFMTEVFPSF